MFVPASNDICISAFPNGFNNLDNSMGSNLALKFEWNDNKIFLIDSNCKLIRTYIIDKKINL